MHPTFPILILLASASTSSALIATPIGEPGMGQTSLTGRIVVRIESRTRAVPVPVRWVEKSGPKCVAADQLAGAIVNGTDSVDLALKGGTRVRAQFDDDCNALGYYGGFYLKPAGDGQICAGRDTIRTRSGDSCPISKFKRLVAKGGKAR
jgi:hypothetical protein